jgi:hypothetical protein
MKVEHFVEQACMCSTGNSEWNRTPQTRMNAGVPAEQATEHNLSSNPGTFHHPLRGGTVEQAERGNERAGTVYRCAAPGCRRLCVGWLCQLHRKEAQK